MSRRRVSASPELSWRQDQALGTTMRIVRELGPTAFVLQEEDRRAAELRVEEERGRRRAKTWDPHSPLRSPGRRKGLVWVWDASIWLCIFFKRPEFISCKANLASPLAPFLLLASQLILKLKASLSGTTGSLQHKNSQIWDVLTVDGECF